MPKQSRHQTLAGLGICIVAGILLTILAPYNTGQISFLPRLIYWTVLCVAGGLGAAIFTPLTRAMNWSPSFLWRVIGQSFTSSLLVSAVLIGWSFYRGNPINLVEAITLFFFVLVIGVMITAFINLLERSNSKNTEPQKQAVIHNRLKPKFRSADIYALSAEDHYVRVITSKGEDLILMRLSDAMKELGTIKGLPVHRSWWVAEAGINTAKKSNGKISIELLSGQIVPVSRSKAKAVKDAGWV